MHRIDRLFQDKEKNILNVYFTAGFPKLYDTSVIIESLASAGVDIIEIGMPFSDPIADGPTIQRSNQQALDNGIDLDLIFDQLKGIREKVQIPLILMGYINPILQFGLEKFCQKASQIGIDALIVPDLPMYEYLTLYRDTFEHHGLYNIFLITPQTSEERIREIDQNTQGFIYMVSSASITGAKREIQKSQIDYFQRIDKMDLKNPTLIGFGISNRETFAEACQYAQGAIVGSAFIDVLQKSDNLKDDICQFVTDLKSDA